MSQYMRDDWQRYREATETIAAAFCTTVACTGKNGQLRVDFGRSGLTPDQAKAVSAIEDLIALATESPESAFEKPELSHSAPASQYNPSTQMKIGGITFRTGVHLWSNPSLRDQDAGIPVILARPTFLDLVLLARRKPVSALLEINQQLFDAGEIGSFQHRCNIEMLTSIEKASGAR